MIGGRRSATAQKLRACLANLICPDYSNNLNLDYFTQTLSRLIHLDYFKKIIYYTNEKMLLSED
jgi:hypothetical protein